MILSIVFSPTVLTPEMFPSAKPPMSAAATTVFITSLRMRSRPGPMRLAACTMVLDIVSVLETRTLLAAAAAAFVTRSEPCPRWWPAKTASQNSWRKA